MNLFLLSHFHTFTLSHFLTKTALTILAALLLYCNASSGIVITEIMPKPAAGGEWLELYNETNSNVNLKNWSLFDAADNGGIVSEIDIIVTPGNFLIISQDSETVNLLNLEPSVQVIIPSSWTPMNNDGDHLTLLNADNILIDEIEYSSEACPVAGRSWERIDFKRPGLEGNNWGACADLRGHTAGRPNSLTAAIPGIKTSVNVDPNPFNPFRGERTVINFTLPVEVVRVTVEIFDLTGRKNRSLVRNIPAGSVNPSLEWDGRDDSNRLVVIGRYIVFMQAVDAQNGKIHTAKCTVVVADKL